MSRPTEKYKRSFAGSVGAGISSLVNSAGRTYYVLEHKVTTKYHRAGESQKIIVDQIELGRDPSCQIRFDEDFGTVSRKHAAIVRDGENWTLVQLSTTNSTFLNGRSITKEWYLQSGDEIQLSVNGPKMGFIVPQGKQGLTSSIKLTERLNLFRQQALRPYKRAIATLSIVLVLAVGGLGAWNVVEHNYWVKKERFAKDEAEKKYAEYQAIIASINVDQVKADSLFQAERKRNESLRGQVHKLNMDLAKVRVNAGIADNSILDECFKHVFYIRVEEVDITFPNGKKAKMDGSDYGWSGTGFMLNDGRLVTARHVVEGWQYIKFPWNEEQQKYIPDDDNGFLINKIANNGGKVIVRFGAYTCSGRAVTFTNEDFVCDRKNDKIGTLEMTGETLHISPVDYTDWASIHTNEEQGLSFDNNLSTSLKRGNKLIVLGYPKGYLTQNITPLSGSGVVAYDGLDKGVILTTETNYEEGNSGGPALCLTEDGNATVVGIVSAGQGKTIGFLVPIAVVK